MDESLIVRQGSQIEIASLVEKATDYMKASRSESTRRAYNSDWRHFAAWAQHRGCAALPATVETVVLYLTDLAASHRPVTLRRRVVSIGVAHQLAGVESPHRSAPVRELLSGISRTHGTSPVQKRALMVKDLRNIVRRLPKTRRGSRDQALLTLGLAGAFRRSELVSLDIEDITFVDEGLIVMLRRSKIDQEGEGVEIGIPRGARPETCPVRSVRSWIESSGITSGPLFRGVDRADVVSDKRLSGMGVARAVQRCCELVGLDGSQWGAHSLRSGFATQAAEGDAPAHAIATQGRWSSLTTVHRYIRKGTLFKGNAASTLGL